MDDTGARTLAVGPLPQYLRQRHRAWLVTRYADNRAWYHRLADKGQNPRAMLISCCDSRLNAVEIFGEEPGDLFVVRNVASLVPPHSPDHAHHGTSAAVEYAVKVLKVAHIVVLGHSNCGGVHACHDMCAGLAPELEATASFIGRWMDILRPAYDEVAAATGDIAARHAALERAAVLTSLRNLLSFPFVGEAVGSGDLTLHGCFIEIGTGELTVYDAERDVFV